MKKKYFSFVGGIMLGSIIFAASSCKEQGKLQVFTIGEEETYVSDTIPQPQTKRILIDEMSGVDCVNCPAGAELLEEMSAANPGILEIVTVHAGDLTQPFTESRQDMRIDAAKRRAYLNIMGNPGKPASGFDRLVLHPDKKNKYMTEGYNAWPASLATAKATTKTPVNIELTSEFNDEKKQYEIVIVVRYTEVFEGKQSLHIYLTESKIMDIQNTPENKRAEYEFNHVLRDVLTPVDGKPFLTDVPAKEKGRVYIYKTGFKIDSENELQKNWKPENMTVVAFVTANEPDDIHVYHVQSTKLVP